MKCTFSLYLLLTAWVLTSAAHAQPTDDELRKIRNHYYKKIYHWTAEQSYLSPIPYVSEYHLGKNATHQYYLLTASITPHFFIGNGEQNSFAMDIQPKFQVRILPNASYTHKYDGYICQDSSSPVRTPSYIPGIQWFSALKRHITDRERHVLGLFIENVSDSLIVKDRKLQSKAKNQLEKAELPYSYWSLYMFHFSNGQDGNHINSNVGVKKQDGSIEHFPRQFNIYNGNFAVDLSGEIAFHIGKWKRGKSGCDTTRLYTSLDKSGYKLCQQCSDGKHCYFHNWDHLTQWRIGLQHYIYLGENKLLGQYGLGKLNIRYQNIAVSHWSDADDKLKGLDDSDYEFGRLVINGSLGFTGFVNKPLRFWPTIEVAYHWSFHQFFRSTTTSTFAAIGYKSQDDYNVYLEDSFPYARIGLTLGFKVYSDKRETYRDGKVKFNPVRVNSKDPTFL
ncbi:hypothetical protein [Spirosoma flavum]|uniref:DUF4421 domain-containing protein n=1 Tax=Spirosoma flavum TaxID=2048557 RepID=A0ABW6ALL7_9BACT